MWKSIVGIMRAALNKYKALKDPVGYAKSIGVNVVGGYLPEPQLGK